MVTDDIRHLYAKGGNNVKTGILHMLHIYLGCLVFVHKFPLHGNAIKIKQYHLSSTQLIKQSSSQLLKSKGQTFDMRGAMVFPS